MFVKVILRYTYVGVAQQIVYEINMKDNLLETLKQEVLKRFGNIDDIPNRLLKQKPLFKQITKNATSTTEWVQTIHQETDWQLEIIA